MAGILTRGLPSAGLYAGPAAWLVDTQAAYALVPWVCASQAPVIPLVALAMASISLLGGFLSSRAYAAAPTPSTDSSGGRPHRFVVLIGIGMAPLFTAIIILHGIAGMVFHGCER